MSDCPECGSDDSIRVMTINDPEKSNALKEWVNQEGLDVNTRDYDLGEVGETRQKRGATIETEWRIEFRAYKCLDCDIWFKARTTAATRSGQAPPIRSKDLSE